MIAALETHPREDKGLKVMYDVNMAGGTPIMSPGTKSESSETGTSGGAMIFHKNWLQSAAPAIAEGPTGAELPE